MRRIKYAAIRAVDWIDATLLRHYFYPRLCHWLAEHPWWDCGPGTDDGGAT